MSENTPKASEEAAGVPESIASEIGTLAADVEAMRKRAVRGWKTSLILWAVLLIVIFSYLFVLRGALMRRADPESVVQMGLSAVEGALQARGVPGLDAGQLGPWMATKLKDMAPDVMQNQVRPKMEELLAQLPQRRQELAQKITAKAPEWADKGVVYFGEKMIPEVEKRLLAMVDQNVTKLLDQFSGQIEGVIQKVLAESKGAIDALGPGSDMSQLRRTMELAFEDAIGPVLDELLRDLDKKVANVRISIADLVDSYEADTLTYEQGLEVRLIQLTLAIFEGTSITPASGGGLLDSLAPPPAGASDLLAPAVTPEEKTVRGIATAPLPVTQEEAEALGKKAAEREAARAAAGRARTEEANK